MKIASYTLVVNSLSLILLGSFGNVYYTLTHIGLGFLSILFGIVLLFALPAYWLNSKKGYLLSFIVSTISLSLISFFVIYLQSLNYLDIFFLISLPLNIYFSLKLYTKKSRKERGLHPLDLPVFG